MEHNDILKDYKTVHALSILSDNPQISSEWIGQHTMKQIDDLIKLLKEAHFMENLTEDERKNKVLEAIIDGYTNTLDIASYLDAGTVYIEQLVYSLRKDGLIILFNGELNVAE